MTPSFQRYLPRAQFGLQRTLSALSAATFSDFFERTSRSKAELASYTFETTRRNKYGIILILYLFQQCEKTTSRFFMQPLQKFGKMSITKGSSKGNPVEINRHIFSFLRQHTHKFLRRLLVFYYLI